MRVSIADSSGNIIASSPKLIGGASTQLQWMQLFRPQISASQLLMKKIDEQIKKIENLTSQSNQTVLVTQMDQLSGKLKAWQLIKTTAIDMISKTQTQQHNMEKKRSVNTEEGLSPGIHSRALGFSGRHIVPDSKLKEDRRGSFTETTEFYIERILETDDQHENESVSNESDDGRIQNQLETHRLVVSTTEGHFYIFNLEQIIDEEAVVEQQLIQTIYSNNF